MIWRLDRQSYPLSGAGWKQQSKFFDTFLIISKQIRKKLEIALL